MCTVSWIHQAGGYRLFCNRDEKKTRPVALSPDIQSRRGVRFVAPVDPQSGGSWIAVNEFGVSICLLNGESAGQASQQSRRRGKSRGMLPIQLIAGTSACECVLQLQQLVLTAFAPFTILFLQSDTPAIVGTWDGQRLAITHSADSLLPLTSSSFEPHRVSKARRQRFFRRVRVTGQISAELLHDFHSSGGERHDAYSSCMHRVDAETVSFSQVVVKRNRIHFQYSPSPRCRSTSTQEVVLGRAA